MPWSRCILGAAGGYLLLALALFPGLWWGEILHPGAVLSTQPPFAGHTTTRKTSALHAAAGDVWRYNIPVQYWQYQAGQQGRVPVWSNALYGGFPVLADGESCLFYPLHGVYYLLHPDVVRGPLAIFRLWMSALATYTLLRHLSISCTGAFLAGGVWMLGAFNIRWLLWTVANASLFLPLLLWTLEYFFSRPSLRRWALLALAATFLQLSGHPEAQFLVGLLAGVYALTRAADWGWRGAPPRLAAALLAMLVGLAGAACALWPFALQLARSADWHERLHHRETLPPSVFILLISPDHYGRPLAGNSYIGPINYVEVAGYFGVFPLCLALALLPTRLARTSSSIPSIKNTTPTTPQERDRRFILRLGKTCFWLGLLGALGGPCVEVILGNLPLFHQADPRRLLLSLQWGGALLAGLAWTLWAEDPTSSIGRRLGLRVIVLLTLFLCLLTLYFALDHAVKLPTRRWSSARVWHDGSFRALLGIFGAFGLLGCAGWLHFGPGRWQGGARWLLLGLVMADLYWVAAGFNPTCPAKLAHPPVTPLLRQLIERADSGRMVGTDYLLSPNLGLVYGWRDSRGYDMPMPARLVALQRRLQLPLGVTAIAANRIFPILDAELAAFWDRVGTRVLFTDVQAPALRVAGSNSRWPLLAKQGGGFLYENPRAYPRAWLAETFGEVHENRALDYLLDPNADLRIYSVVEGLPNTRQPALKTPAQGMVTMERDEDETVEISCDTPTGGLLVLGDRMDDGWRVTVDGVPSLPVTANYFFRGVVVPPGQHLVKWTYVCPGLSQGLITSAVTWLLLGLLLLRKE